MSYGTIITKADFLAYKNVAGIYMFRNLINNKMYIGQSVNLYHRLSEHLYRINKGTFDTHVLYRAVRKYGIENFEISILVTFPPHDQLRKNLNLSEKIYIQFYDTYKNGYNSTLGGDGTIGVKWSSTRKKKFSQYMKEHPTLDLENNVKSKHVYIYNFNTHEYFDYKSCSEAARHNNLYCNSVSDCARGKIRRAGSFVCAYSEKELDKKIKEFEEWFSKNKYKSVSPNYEEYFNWLLDHADHNGLVPTAKEIASQFGINESSVPDWNKHIHDRIEKVRIGNRDRIKIKNYDEFKDKKVERIGNIAN